MRFDEKTILIVDDDPSVLTCVQTFFENHGYHTLTADSGEEALEILVDYDGFVDLVVTDIVLPAMKGTDLVKKLSRLYPDTKVLYMSGYMCPAITQDEYVNRKKAFIQKPFIPREILKASERLLEQRSLENAEDCSV